MAERHAILVVDLAYGDCGKGTIVDFLARRTGAHTVVRFNGGPQAGHNVVTPDGRHHTFSQFGSAAFVPGMRTLLSRFMLVEPYALLNEAAHLAQVGVRDALAHLLIDERCPIITPAHQAANRIRELARGDAAHGTCGIGVGETMQDLLEFPENILHAADLLDRETVARKLRAIRDLKMDQLAADMSAVRGHPKARFSLDTLIDCSWIDTAIEKYTQVGRLTTLLGEAEVRRVFAEPGTIIFEGAQGVLLDEILGFHPHTTWSRTTFDNAMELLRDAGFDGRMTRIGVLRSYITRHGAGPLITEDRSLRDVLREPHNNDGGWQGRFRAGVFDTVAARYAVDVVGNMDFLAVTHLDALPQLPPRMCVAYQVGNGGDVGEFFDAVGNKISRIRKQEPADTAYQERLTGMCRRCRPVYRELAGMTPDTFLKAMQDELQIRVGITSSGPTANDKVIVFAGSLPW